MQNLKTLALSLAVGAFAVAGNASAAIDTAGTLASINEGGAAGVVVALAFGVAVWGIRAVKLMRRG